MATEQTSTTPSAESNEKLHFDCPHCKLRIAVAAKFAGRRGKCTRCAAVITIPTAETIAKLGEHSQLLENLQARTEQLRGEIRTLELQRASMSVEIQQSYQARELAKRELALLEENLEDISYGLYQPHFTYEDSDSYKAAINALRAKQKSMVRSGGAADCSTTWTVGESARDGQRMTKQYQKLLLRAFNGEAEAAIANVTWSNFRVMETRIRKAHDAINKLGTVMQMSVTEAYRDLRLEELRLVFERAEKKRREAEDLRRQRAQLREEEKVQRELAKAQEEAEKDEQDFATALQRAREEANAAAEAERGELEQRVSQLETQLAEAQAKRERAIAQAQLTKSGHVYVISNIGSFGDHVYKIGLTRRLDPVERIRELGDASVPFGFDLHALIYSNNAPELESTFHTHFWDRRVNTANERKEFFRVQLEEIEEFVRKSGLGVEFTRMAEAREYRQALAMVTANSSQSCEDHKSEET